MTTPSLVPSDTLRSARRIVSLSQLQRGIVGSRSEPVSPILVGPLNRGGHSLRTAVGTYPQVPIASPNDEVQRSGSVPLGAATRPGEVNSASQ